MKMISIFINGEKKTTPHYCLKDILEECGYEQIWVASAVNGVVIPAAERESFMVKAGDKLEILSPMQGG